MNLLSLPNELLLLIINDVKEDLPALTLVCHELKGKALPELYKTICLSPFQCGTNHKYKYSVYLLARTFLENPSLEDLVRHAYFLGQESAPSAWWERREVKKEPDADTLKLMKDHIYQSEMLSPDSWISELEAARVDVYVALVLSKMTGLRTLAFEAGQHEISPVFLKGALLDSPAQCMSKFSELRNVALGTRREYKSICCITRLDISHVSPLFYLPAIESIEIHDVKLKSQFDWPGSKKPQCRSLKTLILGETTTNPRVLAQILEVTPQLRTLEFSETFRITRDSDESPENWKTWKFDLSDLGDALLNARKSLTKLVLGIECFAFSSILTPNPLNIIANRLGPLDTFEELEYLEISPVCLFGSSKQSWSANETLLHLPPSLKVLYLSFRKNMSNWGDSEWSTDCLERLGLLLKDKEKIVPSLECIFIHVWDVFVNFHEPRPYLSGWSSYQREIMKEMCRSASVECRFIDYKL